MEIKTITITAEASKAYQKYCVALTAESIEGDEDINTLKHIAITKAMEGIEELAGNIGQAEVKVSTTPVQNVPQPRNVVKQNPVQNQYRAAQNNGYQRPAAPVAHKQSNPPTEKQISMLYSLGYDGDINALDSKAAFEVIKQLRGY